MKRRTEWVIEEQVEEIDLKAADMREMEVKHVFQGKKSNSQLYQSISERDHKHNATNDSLEASSKNYETNRASIDFSVRASIT